VRTKIQKDWASGNCRDFKNSIIPPKQEFKDFSQYRFELSSSLSYRMKDIIRESKGGRY
jgi:hypothetical protein